MKDIPRESGSNISSIYLVYLSVYIVLFSLCMIVSIVCIAIMNKSRLLHKQLFYLCWILYTPVTWEMALTSESLAQLVVVKPCMGSEWFKWTVACVFLRWCRTFVGTSLYIRGKCQCGQRLERKCFYNGKLVNWRIKFQLYDGGLLSVR